MAGYEKPKHDHSPPPDDFIRTRNNRRLAYLLVGIGVLWIACNVCVLPVGIVGSLMGNFGTEVGAMGTNIGEWGSDFGQQMGEMGTEIGQWGADFGHAMGTMGSDFGRSMGQIGSIVGQVFSSICATICAFGLIIGGLVLLLTRRSPSGVPAAGYEKPKHDDLDLI